MLPNKSYTIWDLGDGIDDPWFAPVSEGLLKEGFLVAGPLNDRILESLETCGTQKDCGFVELSCEFWPGYAFRKNVVDVEHADDIQVSGLLDLAGGCAGSSCVGLEGLLACLRGAAFCFGARLAAGFLATVDALGLLPLKLLDEVVVLLLLLWLVGTFLCFCASTESSVSGTGDIDSASAAGASSFAAACCGVLRLTRRGGPSSS